MTATENTKPRELMQNFEILKKPHRILIFSGKRKSGKDFITDVLHERIGKDRSVILKLSGPIKNYWARKLNLNIDALLSDKEYKEKYRCQMAKWGEDVRNQDYGYFCRASIEMYNAWDKPVWIISDARRKTDVKWFIENFGDVCRTIRVISNEEVRKSRGWSFVPGVDDAETECDLDDVDKWDLKVENNKKDISDVINQLLELIT